MLYKVEFQDGVQRTVNRDDVKPLEGIEVLN